MVLDWLAGLRERNANDRCLDNSGANIGLNRTAQGGVAACDPSQRNILVQPRRPGGRAQGADDRA